MHTNDFQVRKLFDQADEAAKRVTTDVGFRRQDRAYVEYIVCSEILLNIIPKHKDYSAITSDRGEWQRRYRALCKVSRAPNLSVLQIRPFGGEYSAQIMEAKH